MANSKTRLNNWKVFHLKKEVQALIDFLNKDLEFLENRKIRYAKQVRRNLKNDTTDCLINDAYSLHWDRAKRESVKQFLNQVSSIAQILNSKTVEEGLNVIPPIPEILRFPTSFGYVSFPRKMLKEKSNSKKKVK